VGALEAGTEFDSALERRNGSGIFASFDVEVAEIDERDG
jgi:hypothetical protein